MVFLQSERFFVLFGPAECTKADAKFLKQAVPRDFKESSASASMLYTSEDT